MIDTVPGVDKLVHIRLEVSKLVCLEERSEEISWLCWMAILNAQAIDRSAGKNRGRC